MLPLPWESFLGGTLHYLYTQDTKAVEARLSVVLFSLLGTPFSRNGHLYSCLARLGKWEASILCDDDWHVGHSNWSQLSAWSNAQLWPSRVWTGTLLDNGFRWLFLSQHRPNGREKKMTKQSLYLGFGWDLAGFL